MSLRNLARSRCLRAMGLVAWLMLLSTSLVAAPMDMDGHVHSAVQVAVMAAGDHCPTDAAVSGSLPAHPLSSDCCGGHAVPGCHCTAMCASVVPASLTMIGAAPLATGYAMSPRVTAPSPNTAAPLRPPSI